MRIDASQIEGVIAHLEGENSILGMVRQIEHAESNRAEAAAVVTEIYTDVRDRGIHDGALRAIVKLRKMKPGQRAEWLRHFDAYRAEVGLDDQAEMGI